MSTDRWREIERLFHEALERPAAERTAFLDAACAGDEELRREVETLARSSDQAGSFIEHPPLEAVAPVPNLRDDRRPSGGETTGAHRTPLQPGATVSHFRVLEKIGVGGMGEVWRARDTQLNRDVALKVLPEILARDPELMARFKREAQVLASLNHPNIAAIHGFEESGGVHALVMELAEGPTLAERLKSGTMACDEALPLAKQIADALEYAHEKGIIHRDLKPANINITPGGTAKLLDFGLAKALGGDAQGTATSRSPASGPELSVTPTRTGLILGTASYMSPEQARGKKVDRRADIWAFGCVLFEMITGKRLFCGETISDTLAAILKTEPDLGALPAGTPPRIRELIRRCLVKDAKQRLRDIGDARIAIEEVIAGVAPEGIRPGNELTAAGGRRGSFLQRVLPWAAGMLIGAAAGGLIVWLALGSQNSATRLPQELSEQRLTANPSENPLRAAAISPDGKLLAYSDQNGTHLRLIKTGETRDLVTSRQMEVSSICWLPDGSGILATGSQHEGPPGIWVISVLGGAPRKLRDNASQPAVSPDGSRVAFVAGPGSGAPSEIWVMNASGEEARKVLTAQADQTFSRPAWSPDGHRIMYLRSYFTAGSHEKAIESVDLKGKSAARVVSSPTLGDFCWLPDGRVLYTRQMWVFGIRYGSESSLLQIRVDPQTGKPQGAPEKVANGAGFSFSGLSRTADGKQLVFLKWISQSDVSVGDLNAQKTSLSAPRQLTFSESDDWVEGWTPDSKAVFFWSDRTSMPTFYKKNLTGGDAVKLFQNSKPVWYGRYSPDGSWFLYMALPKLEPPGPTVPVNLMRVAVSGGPPQLVLRARGMSNLRCTRSPANVCIYDEFDQQGRSFFQFDPIRGNSREVAHVAHAPNVGSSTWDLSPDGARLAVTESAKSQEGRIKLIPLDGKPPSEMTVKGWSGLTGIDWSPNGKALYVSSETPQHDAVLRVDLTGRARLLWEGNPMLGSCGRPSPDGRHLAIAIWTTDSNAWIMKNF